MGLLGLFSSAFSLLEQISLVDPFFSCIAWMHMLQETNHSLRNTTTAFSLFLRLRRIFFSLTSARFLRSFSVRFSLPLSRFTLHGASPPFCFSIRALVLTFAFDFLSFAFHTSRIFASFCRPLVFARKSSAAFRRSFFHFAFLLVLHAFSSRWNPHLSRIIGLHVPRRFRSGSCGCHLVRVVGTFRYTATPSFLRARDDFRRVHALLMRHFVRSSESSTSPPFCVSAVRSYQRAAHRHFLNIVFRLFAFLRSPMGIRLLRMFTYWTSPAHAAPVHCAGHRSGALKIRLAVMLFQARVSHRTRSGATVACSFSIRSRRFAGTYAFCRVLRHRTFSLAFSAISIFRLNKQTAVW